jgi:hypothetical protein
VQEGEAQGEGQEAICAQEVGPVAMGLAERLRLHQSELEAAALARVTAVADPTEIDDPEYLDGLRSAVGPAFDYALAALERDDEATLPMPAPLLAQARLAARNGVTLDTILRRYFAGYALLVDRLVAEAERADPVPTGELQRLLRTEAEFFDRLVATVSAEYRREVDELFHSADRHRAHLVVRLLAGQPVDSRELSYPLDGWHVALLSSGPDAVAAIRDLAAGLDRRLLLVHRGDVIWAWLGGRERLPACELLRLVERDLPVEVAIGAGEPGEGMAGWRLSHRQAKAAMAVLRRDGERLARYGEVALLASALRDEVLADSLTGLYLAPLEMERDGGAVLRRTLRAYFEVGRKVSPTASSLGVSRKTVSVRLRSVGERIGRPVDSCATELETALRLRGLHE